MITRRVLIPLDRSVVSQKIFDPIINFIPVEGTELILFHTAHPPQSIGVTPPEYQILDFTTSIYTSSTTTTNPKKLPHPIYAHQVEATLRSELTEELTLSAVNLTKAGYLISIEIRFGEPAQEILRFIQHEQINLVAMTTHAREGLSRLIFGSVAEKILHHISIPVLLLHPSVNN